MTWRALSAWPNVAAEREAPQLQRGRAVQVDPIKHMLKAPRINPLKLKYDTQVSSFALKLDLRRYSVATEMDVGAFWKLMTDAIAAADRQCPINL